VTSSIFILFAFKSPVVILLAFKLVTATLVAFKVPVVMLFADITPNTPEAEVKVPAVILDASIALATIFTAVIEFAAILSWFTASVAISAF